MAGRDVQITSEALPTVSGDSQALQIILHEDVHNALKFTRTRPQARLHMRVQEDGAEDRIGVEDNGVGFNLRQKDKAFELWEGRRRACRRRRLRRRPRRLAVTRRLPRRVGSLHPGPPRLAPPHVGL